MIFPKIEKAIKELVYTLPVTCEKSLKKLVVKQVKKLVEKV